MNLFDLVRHTAFFTFGIGVGFMVLTNIIAFKVLRPPKRLGFLWWHITSVSLSFICLGIVAVEGVSGRLGDPPTWRGVLTCTGTILFMIAQILIFKVEKRRLVFTKAAGRVATAHERR